MIDSLICYRLHRAVYLHFKTKYDVFEYNGAVKGITREAFESDKRSVALISRIQRRFKTPLEVIQYLVAQYAYNDSGSDLYDSAASEDNYSRWMNYKPRIAYQAIDDIASVDISTATVGDPPPLFPMISRGTFQLESAVVLNNLIDFVQDDYFVYPGLARRISKLKRFVRCDLDSVRAALPHLPMVNIPSAMTQQKQA